jgi:hypothetical protein
MFTTNQKKKFGSIKDEYEIDYEKKAIIKIKNYLLFNNISNFLYFHYHFDFDD